MARDKSSKGSSRAKAPAPDRPGLDAGSTTKQPKSRRGFFGLLRSDKSKSKKITETTDHDSSSSRVTPNNNTITRSASFGEVGDVEAKQEQPTKKVKRHLSVSRSGKMKEVRKRTSLSELAQRFETQAKV